MWDKRYDNDEYLYGKEPNDFLAQMAGRIPPGRVLCLADGEGRNGVFLATLGYKVLSVDASGVGLAKARKLAAEKGVSLETETADLSSYPLPEAAFEGIVSIFCHLPAPVRKELHKKVVRALKPGGVFLLEAYTPQQLKYKTGGPPTVELLMSLDQLKDELAGLEILHGIETTRKVVEGRLHTGEGAVVQLLAKRSQVMV